MRVAILAREKTEATVLGHAGSLYEAMETSNISCCVVFEEVGGRGAVGGVEVVGAECTGELGLMSVVGSG